MKKTLIIITIIINYQLSIVNCMAQPGTLDESFGNAGKVVIDNIYDAGLDVDLQSDGKIITMGITNTFPENRFIIRLNNDGSIDESFGENGYAYYTFPSNSYKLLSLAIQEDDKIIIAGDGTSYTDEDDSFSPNYDIFLARFKSNGVIDSSFGENGYVTANLGAQEFCNDILILPDGKILAAGNWQYEYGSTASFLLVRYMPDGNIDKSFGTEGRVVTGFGEWVSGSIASIAIQEDGKIVAGGGASNRTSINTKLAFARYFPDGKLDESFGTKGQNVIDVSNVRDGISHIGILQSGNIIASGYTGLNALGENDSMLIISCNPSGSIDKNFGNNGIISTKFGGIAAYAYSLSIESDNKILIAGSWLQNKDANGNFLVARFNSNGTQDNTFGQNGFQVTDFGIFTQAANASVFQKDNKITIAGVALSSQMGIYSMALARYNNDAVLPVSFQNISTTINRNSITLNWQTANETNNSFFSIEKTGNTTNFLSIGQVQSNKSQVYSFTDTKPLAGNNYYRIKQVDKDGKFTYSKTVSATFANSHITLKPNPATNEITIEGLIAMINYECRIMNVQGEIFIAGNLSSSNNKINISNLKTGLYFIKINDGEKENILKFIKQ